MAICGDAASSFVKICDRLGTHGLYPFIPTQQLHQPKRIPKKSRDDRQATRPHLLPQSPGWCESGSTSQSAEAAESFDPSNVFSTIFSASKIALGSNHELMQQAAGTPPAGNVSTLQGATKQLKILPHPAPISFATEMRLSRGAIWKTVNSLMLIRRWRSLPWFGQGLRKLSL